MKDNLIAISNELLDNVTELTPEVVEKLRHDRFAPTPLPSLCKFLSAWNLMHAKLRNENLLVIISSFCIDSIEKSFDRGCNNF